jgi:hypothetical protein
MKRRLLIKFKSGAHLNCPFLADLPLLSKVWNSFLPPQKVETVGAGPAAWNPAGAGTEYSPNQN